MVGKTKRASAQERKRMQTLKEHIPCICCMLLTSYSYRLPEIHHRVSGYKRHGHQETIPLCEYHHRGLRPDGLSAQECLGTLGPALTDGRATFEAFFGPEELLLKYTNKLLATWAQEQWMDYMVPHRVRVGLREDWCSRRQGFG